MTAFGERKWRAVVGYSEGTMSWNPQFNQERSLYIAVGIVLLALAITYLVVHR